MNKNINLIAIDPGLNGGIATLRRGEIRVVPMPTKKVKLMAKGEETEGTEIDLKALNILIRRSQANQAIVEFQHPSQGYKQGKMQGGIFSASALLECYGATKGILVAHGIETDCVPPLLWQPHVLNGMIKRRAEVEALIKKYPKFKNYATKAASVCFCQWKYPDISLLPTPRKKIPHDGMADALCLLEFLMMKIDGDLKRYQSSLS